MCVSHWVRCVRFFWMWANAVTILELETEWPESGVWAQDRDKMYGRDDPCNWTKNSCDFLFDFRGHYGRQFVNTFTLLISVIVSDKSPGQPIFTGLPTNWFGDEMHDHIQVTRYCEIWMQIIVRIVIFRFKFSGWPRPVPRFFSQPIPIHTFFANIAIVRSHSYYCYYCYMKKKISKRIKMNGVRVCALFLFICMVRFV